MCFPFLSLSSRASQNPRVDQLQYYAHIFPPHISTLLTYLTSSCTLLSHIRCTSLPHILPPHIPHFLMHPPSSHTSLPYTPSLLTYLTSLHTLPPHIPHFLTLPPSSHTMYLTSSHPPSSHTSLLTYLTSLRHIYRQILYGKVITHIWDEAYQHGGNYESRNGMERGTERGTEVRCGQRARLDWTHPKICKMHFSV